MTARAVQDIFSDERAITAEIDRLRAISLSHFRFENTWLKVESDLLPSLEFGEIYICSNKDIEREIKAANKGNVVIYGPGELKRIIALDPGPESMKAIHAAKAVLGGRVVETKPELPYPEPGPFPSGPGPRLQGRDAG